MNMNNSFVCCEQCFKTIGKRNVRAARLWLDFCAMKLQKGDYIYLKPQDFPELRVLETLGFLMSTDTDESIVVRVNGYMHTDDGAHFFCVKEDEHG